MPNAHRSISVIGETGYDCQHAFFFCALNNDSILAFAQNPTQASNNLNRTEQSYDKVEILTYNGQWYLFGILDYPDLQGNIAKSCGHGVMKYVNSNATLG